MKKFILFYLLLLIILTIPVTAHCSWQGIDAWTGAEWEELNAEIKPVFLQGMIEGLKFRGPEMGPWIPVSEEIEDYVPELDKLYEDPENSNIPIVLVLDYVNCEFAGMSEDELDLRLKKLKEIAGMN